MLDLSAVVTRMLPVLGASSAADLTFWDTNELYAWMDEAAKRLARECGAFVDRDASTAIAAGAASYATPARHVSTIQVSIDTRALRPATVQELEALDDGWPDTTGTPERWLHDVGLATVRLYPAPSTASGTLGVVCHRYPPEITASAAQVAAPRVLEDYFVFSALAAARAKETKAQMPEVSAWFGQLAGLMEQAVTSLWGGAQ